MRSRDARRVQLLIFAIIGGTALVAAILLATGSIGDGDSIRVRAAEGAHGNAEAPRQADNIADFVKAHGQPPDATYGRMRIPAISVDAPLTYRLVKSDMPDPSGPSDVAYYDMSKFPGLGGVPGGGHNAIFAGHVDLNREIPYARAHYEGPAVFWSLDRLRPGDVVEIDVKGKTLKYTVVSASEVSAKTTDWAKIWSSDVKKDTVTLFTCGGTFDPDTREYSRRLIVRAERS